MFDMVEDIMIYLESEDKDECEISQQCIGIGWLFRDFMVKDQKGADFQCNKHRMLSKILVHH